MLYSYCIPFDDGAAPNPFFSFCTLNICKPKIRLKAEVGDWVIGTGSKNSPINDISKKLVYAMKLTFKIPMKKYDQFCIDNCPQKIPNWKSNILEERLGDSIYKFFDNDKIELRPSVHTEENMPKDLSGEYTLISNYFYYFGDNPIGIPVVLYDIIKEGQGHKSISISHLEKTFVSWIENCGKKSNILHGSPQIQIFKNCVAWVGCARAHNTDSDEEENLTFCK